jgi:hypothetical protein
VCVWGVLLTADLPGATACMGRRLVGSPTTMLWVEQGNTSMHSNSPDLLQLTNAGMSC